MTILNRTLLLAAGSSALFFLATPAFASEFVHVTSDGTVVQEDLLCADADGGVEGEVQCQDLALAGECEKNPEFMTISCKMSCGFCSNGDVKIEQSECVDIAPEGELQCREWAYHGECETNPAFMKTGCRKSCGVCTSLPAEEEMCEDAFPECTDWAEKGHCFGFWQAPKGPYTINNAYVIEFCPRACNVCDIHLDVRDLTLHLGFPQTAPDFGEIPGLEQRVIAKVEETRKYILSLPLELQGLCKMGHINCARMALGGDCEKRSDDFVFKYLCAATCQTCELFLNNPEEQHELQHHYNEAVEDYQGWLKRQHAKWLKEQEKEKETIQAWS